MDFLRGGRFCSGLVGSCVQGSLGTVPSWREIRRLGAVYLQDGVCLVPSVLDMDLGVDALREKIVNMGGKAWVFRSTSAATGQDVELENLFKTAQKEDLLELLRTAQNLFRYLEDAKTHFDMGEEDFIRCEGELRRLRSLLLSLRAHRFFKEPLFDEIETLLKHCHRLLTEGGETSEVGDQSQHPCGQGGLPLANKEIR